MSNHINTRELAKQRRQEVILNKAEELFLRKGIENTTMNDIAQEAGIGIATLFRYFQKKEKIIITIATSKLNNLLISFKEIEEKPISCVEKLTLIFDFFIAQTKEQNAALPKILNNFINYAAVFHDTFEDIDMYTEVHKDTAAVFLRIIKEGETDGTIRSDIEITSYLSTIFSNFSMFTFQLPMKSSTGLIEPELPSEDQLRIMKTIFLDYLKA